MKLYIQVLLMSIMTFMVGCSGKPETLTVVTPNTVSKECLEFPRTLAMHKHLRGMVFDRHKVLYNVETGECATLHLVEADATKKQAEVDAFVKEYHKTFEHRVKDVLLLDVDNDIGKVVCQATYIVTKTDKKRLPGHPVKLSYTIIYWMQYTVDDPQLWGDLTKMTKL